MLEVDTYQLHLDITDDARFTVQAVVSFSVSAGAIGHSTRIDLLGHDVASAELNGRPVAYDGVTLNLEGLRATNELVVTSSAPYSTTGEGLHRYVDPYDEAEYLRSEEHTSELQSRGHLVCRLLLEKKNSNADEMHDV